MLTTESIRVVGLPAPSEAASAGYFLRNSRRKIESIGRPHSSKQRGLVLRTQPGQLRQLQPLRRHAIRENAHHLAAQLFIADGLSHKLLAELLVQSDGMEFVWTHVPPARQRRVRQKLRNQLHPDQSLHIFRRDEILLRRCQRIRQVGQRTQQIAASVGRDCPRPPVQSRPTVFRPL